MWEWSKTLGLSSALVEVGWGPLCPSPGIPESPLWSASLSPYFVLREGPEGLGYQIIYPALGVICFSFFGTTTIKFF